MTADERGILEQIDAALRSDAAAAAIGPVVERVAETMARKPGSIEAWEPIPLEVYGGLLPSAIRSSWVFILRAGVTELAIVVPEGFQVLAVEGQNVKEWALQPAAAGNAVVGVVAFQLVELLPGAFERRRAAKTRLRR